MEEHTLSKLIFLVGTLLVFTTGFITANILSMTATVEHPFSVTSFLTGTYERSSPGDHITEDKIHVYQDEIIIDVQGASWATFTDTNSMDPLFDQGANSLELKPHSTSDVQVGDIISFKTPEGLIVHRIVEIGQDKQGWYAITKGDNNPSVDPDKVRFEDVHGVLVAVVY
jgi:hypothetical protein